MALRNQPYFPFYVNDFMSDEKLLMCSAESTGVYIRLMCLMHKSDEYGVILLKQNFKQNNKQNLNFASMFARILPYDIQTIERSLDELVSEGVVVVDGDRLYQKRMVKDEYISQIRATAGRKGGKNTWNRSDSFKDKSSTLAKANAKAKIEANAINEYEYVNSSASEDSVSSNARAKKAPSIVRGQYGYVKLTDTEYNKLITDLGEQEAKRVIILVDEQAAKTENKNKWKNWNLVCRTASRDGWGAGNNQGQRKNTSGQLNVPVYKLPNGEETTNPFKKMLMDERRKESEQARNPANHVDYEGGIPDVLPADVE